MTTYDDEKTFGSSCGAIALVPLASVFVGETAAREPAGREGLSEMEADVRARGVERPLLLRALGEDRLEVIDGAKRLEAARAAGLDEAPARVLAGVSDPDAASLRQVANIYDRARPLSERLRLLLETRPAMIRFEAGRRRTQCGPVGITLPTIMPLICGRGKRLMNFDMAQAEGLCEGAVALVDGGLLSETAARRVAALDRESQGHFLEFVKGRRVATRTEMNEALRSFMTVEGHIEAARGHLEQAAGMAGREGLGEERRLALAEVARYALSLAGGGPRG